MFTSNKLLSHYNANLPIIEVGDTSNYDVGVVISHVFTGGILVNTASQLQLGYDFDTEFRNKTVFGQADCLSRFNCNKKCSDKENIIASLTTEEDAQCLLFAAVANFL